MYLLTPQRKRKGRSTEQRLNGSERRNSFQLSGVNNGSNGSISSCSPSGAETTDYFPMHNRRTQVTLTDIIGRTDICTVQENEQAIPVFEIPFQESFGFSADQVSV